MPLTLLDSTFTPLANGADPLGIPSVDYNPTDPPAAGSLPALQQPSLQADAALPIVYDQLTGSYYREGYYRSWYLWDEGDIQLTVAGPAGTPTEMVQVHSGRCFRIVEWTVERVAAKPKLPSPNTNNANEVLRYKIIGGTTTVMGVDGTEYYRTSGAYVYALLVPPGDNDSLAVGVPPYNSNSSASYNITPDQFDQRLLESSSTVPAGFTGG